MQVKIDKDKIRAEFNELIEKLLDDEVDAKEKLDIVISIKFLSEITTSKFMVNSGYVEFEDSREED